MGCGGSKGAGGESSTASGEDPWYKKALEGAKSGLSNVGDKMKEAYDKTKPHMVNAANSAWAATKAAAAAAKEAAIDVGDSSKAISQMAVLEVKLRAANKRLQLAKAEFGEKMIEALRESTGDGSAAAEDGKVVGDLKEGTQALKVYQEYAVTIQGLEDDVRRRAAHARLAPPAQHPSGSDRARPHPTALRPTACLADEGGAR
jgi:hypothetical protein